MMHGCAKQGHQRQTAQAVAQHRMAMDLHVAIPEQRREKHIQDGNFQGPQRGRPSCLALPGGPHGQQRRKHPARPARAPATRAGGARAATRRPIARSRRRARQPAWTGCPASGQDGSARSPGPHRWRATPSWPARPDRRPARTACDAKADYDAWTCRFQHRTTGCTRCRPRTADRPAAGSAPCSRGRWLPAAWRQGRYPHGWPGRCL